MDTIEATNFGEVAVKLSAGYLYSPGIYAWEELMTIVFPTRGNVKKSYKVIIVAFFETGI